MFAHNGRPIKSLREIKPDMKLLIASERKQFMGLFRKSHVVTYDRYLKDQEQRIKDERLNTTFSWYRNQIKQSLPINRNLA